MSSLFEPDVQQQTSETKIPEWAKGAILEDISMRRGIANREYTPYEGDRSMQFNDVQNQAFNSANNFGMLAPGAFGNAYNAFTDGTGMSMMQQAFGGLAGGAGNASAVTANRGDIQDVSGGSYLGMDRDAYTNQYVDSVSNDVMSDVQRQEDLQRNALNAQAAKSGAFGGSRHGVEGAILSSEAMRNYGQLSNKLRSQAFDAASGLMGDDLMRGLEANMSNQAADAKVALGNAELGTQANIASAGNQVSALANMASIGQGIGNLSLLQGQALQDFGQSGLEAQLGAGNQIQGADMYNKDQAYMDFLGARDWGMNNFLASGGLNPQGQTGSTSTQDVFGASPFQQGAGIAMSVLGGKSSRAFKEVHGEADVDAVAEKILRMPLFRWEYLPEHRPAANDPERIGPMAENFNEAFPSAEPRIIDYQRHIAALHATVQSLNKRIEELEAKA